MEELWSFTVDPKRSQKRARFNLLTLEHGEYYFQDYSAYFYPPLGAPGSVLRTAGRGTLNGVFDTGMEVRNRPRQQGRLKLCSRGLLFEPADRLLPLVKYPFRHMETQMEPVGVGSMSEAEIRGGGEGFRFRCTVVVESRRNDEVGPYVTKRARDSGTIVEWSDWTFSFSLLHTPVGEFLREARRLREVALRVKEKGHGYEEPLLRPLLEERLRDSTRKFDTIHLVDFRETLLLTCPVRVDRITPLLRNPGCLMITDARVYFQPAELNNVGEPVASFALAGVLRAFKRRASARSRKRHMTKAHMLRQTGLELVMAGDGGSAFFNFEFSRERDDLFDVLMSQPLVGPRAQSASAIEAETRRWQSGQVSNYDYLVFLNTVAGRTVNDLTQYPVFPWVIKDYHSATLNLDDDTVYRDMSRPIGALDAERLEYFRTRFRNMPDPTQHPGQGIPPPFLYGTHYSTPGYALFFLVRSAPEEMLCLQNGRFDDPDRSFTSIKAAWESVLRNHADLKELIPEFYAGDGSFLTNRDDLQLGVTQGGQRVGDVELPPWARNPRDFVRKMRRALESPHVSRRLHLWIDLVFGCKQRGKAAIEADNLFYYLTYEGAVDLEKIDDPRERAALESQISEFGQCPSQLFVGPHPRRDDTMSSIILAPTFGNPRVGAGGPTKDRRFSGGGERGGGSRDRSPYSEKRLSGSLKEVVDPVALLSSLPPPPSASEYLIENLYEDHFGERMTQLQHHQQQQQKQLRRSSGTSRSYPGEKVLGESRRRGGVAVTTQGWSSFPPTSASSTSPVSPLSPSSPTTSAAATLTVGALWKRGLAIAGAVGGAAAEVTGSRGMASRTTPLQQQQQQRWHATGERQARQGSGDPAPESLPSGFAGGGSGGVVGVRGGVGEWRGSPVARVPTAQANAPTPEEPIWRSNSVSTINKGGFPGDMEGALSQGRGEAILSRGGATALAAAKVPAKPNPGATATSGRGSAQSSAVRGTQSSLPPALALATGSERWWLDAWKVELRPGEPMALHRDGVTCAHLVKDLGEAAGPIAGAEAAVAATTRCAVDGAGEHTGRLTLCTSAKDCSLKICSLEREAGGSGPVSKAHTRRRLAGGELALSCCALTQDGKHAVAGSWDNSILLYSVEAACVLSRVEGAHDDGVSCLALHEPASTSDEKRNGAQRKVHGTKTLMLATGSWDAAVKVWTVQSPEMDPLPVLELFDLETPVQALAIDGTGKALAAAGEDGMVAVWDTATGSLLATFRACPDQCPVVSVRWSESDSGDGGPSPGSGKACLVLASAAGDVCRFSPIGAPLGRLRLDSEVVAMDSDGRCTVVACRDGSLRFLGSLQDGGFVQTVIRGSGHETDMTCLRVCAGRAVSGSSGSAPAVGAVIVTGSDAGAVRLWDVVDRCRA